MTIKKFEDILAWQEGRKLAKLVYELTRVGPLSKDFGMKDQIQRAAVSVPSNIAEGFKRSGNREFAHFLWIAKGSAGETASRLYTLRHLQNLVHLGRRGRLPYVGAASRRTTMEVPRWRFCKRLGEK